MSKTTDLKKPETRDKGWRIGGFPVMAETTRNHIFSKEISQVIIAAMVLAPISIEKVVCEWFQLWEEIRLILDISQFFNLKANIDRAATEVKKATFCWQTLPEFGIFSHLWDIHGTISMQYTYPPFDNARDHFAKKIWNKCDLHRKLAATRIISSAAELWIKFDVLIKFPFAHARTVPNCIWFGAALVRCIN